MYFIVIYIHVILEHQKNIHIGTPKGHSYFNIHVIFCRIQAGKYQEALELLKTALKIEEKELGARPHRMVELYALMAEIYDEV